MHSADLADTAHPCLHGAAPGGFLEAEFLAAAGDLLRVMPGVHHVELEPLINGERPKDRVVQHLSFSESLPGLDRRVIQSRKATANGVENREQIELTGRQDVFGCLTALGKHAEVNERELPHSLHDLRRGRERCALLEAAFETFRSPGIRARQVFDDFDHRPTGGIAMNRTLRAAAPRRRFDDLLAFLQVRADHVVQVGSVQ